MGNSSCHSPTTKRRGYGGAFRTVKASGNPVLQQRDSYMYRARSASAAGVHGKGKSA